MKTTFLSIAVLASVLSAPVFADDSVLGQQSDMVQMLLKYDTSGDGIISREEMLAGKTTEFNAADTNTDTFLSFAEFKAADDARRAERTSSMFGVMDTDKSGSVSAAEFAAAFADKTAAQAATAFSLTAGSDASLSLDEMSALGSSETGRLVWAFASKDKDGDSQLSVDEYTEAPAKNAQTTTKSGTSTSGTGTTKTGTTSTTTTTGRNSPPPRR